MKSFGSILFLLFRLICYLALVVVVLGFATAFILPGTGACSDLGTGGVKCSSPFYQSLGEYALGVMLVSAFTGFPVLLALAGAFFAIRKLYLWRTSGGTPANDLQPDHVPAAQKQSFGMFLLKGFGILMGAAIVLGIVGGIMGSGGP